MGNPQHPSAPRFEITIPQLYEVLKRPGILPNLEPITATDLLEPLPNGVWLLKANLDVHQNARLLVANPPGIAPQLSELRMKSVATNNPPPLLQDGRCAAIATDLKLTTKIVITGGQMLVSGVKVVAWDSTTDAPDTNFSDGRAYIAAQYGARLDITSADIGYLGCEEANPALSTRRGKGDVSGISWRHRATPNDPATGAVGSIRNSKIHHGYFGMYTYQAISMSITGNQFFSHAVYGLDPHDDSNNFVIAYNEIYGNGSHGLIISRRCINNQIYNNRSFNNGGHGFMLDRGSDKNDVHHNHAFNNSGDGLVIFQSQRNTIADNTIWGNQIGLRIDATWDMTDTFDSLSNDNLLRNNSIYSNRGHGITLVERSDRNQLINNTLRNNGEAGIYIATGLNSLNNNWVSDNRGGAGVVVVGSKAYSRPSNGDPRYVRPLGQPGVAISLTGNLIQANLGDGLLISQGANNVIGNAGINLIRDNGRYGVQITENSSKNVVQGNLIWQNLGHGVYIRSSFANRITRNSIAENGLEGIALRGGNGDLPSPQMLGIQNGRIAGTAAARAVIEIFRDADGEGSFFLATTTAAANGAWSVAVPANDNPDMGLLSATATDTTGNTSSFGRGSQFTAANVDESAEGALAAATTLLLAQYEGQASLTASDDLISAPDDARSQPVSEEAAQPAISQQVFLPLVASQ